MVASMNEGFGFHLSHLASDPNDRLRWNLTNLFCPFWSIIDDLISQLLKANGLFLDKFFIVELFLHHHIDHRKKEGQIGSRFDGKPFISEDGGFAVSRIDHNQPCPLFLCLNNAFHLTEINPSCRIAANDHDVLRVREVVGGKFSYGGHPASISCCIASRTMSKVVGT